MYLFHKQFTSAIKVTDVRVSLMAGRRRVLSIHTQDLIIAIYYIPYNK